MSLTATRSEQDQIEGRIPGNKGIWAGILAEMTEFALLFGVYFIARAHFPKAFHDGPLQLSLFSGTLNTVLMISGSYFVANAVIAIRQNRPGIGLRWLVLVLFAACGYFVTKYFEFRWNVEHGVTGRTGIFFTVYYYPESVVFPADTRPLSFRPCFFAFPFRQIHQNGCFRCSES